MKEAIWGFVKEKLLSRKFLAVVAGVIAAFFGVITWDAAIQLATVWLGVQGITDAVSASKKEKKVVTLVDQK